ncbi:Protein kinase superfamily protein [Zea mays]|uniref:Protein kinase superfamily protein n=1 Tax=Zea mays TaxID=4577 RepID=A0A1D6LNC1_MAIZE|nr:Protein kinase superfamily protein [Zea mays]AQK81066.1 Protein kinase superfamily protein [Zea mays]
MTYMRADGGELPRAVQAPEPGGAHRLLLRGQPPAAGVRVHGQGQPGAPSVPPRLQPDVDDAGSRRAPRRQGPRLPPRLRPPHHLPGLQDLQHLARRGIQREAIGLRAGQGGADGRRDARIHQGHGHLRLRRAGVHSHRAPDGDERRVRLRRGAAGDAGGAARAGAEPGGGPRRQPGGLGAAHPDPAQQAGADPGPADGQGGPGDGARARGPPRLRLPQPQPQGPALHGEGRRHARGRPRRRRRRPAAVRP